MVAHHIFYDLYIRQPIRGGGMKNFLIGIYTFLLLLFCYYDVPLYLFINIIT